VEPRERDEPKKPTTCVSGRLIRSCATRHVSGGGLTVDGVDRGSTQFFSGFVPLRGLVPSGLPKIAPLDPSASSLDKARHLDYLKMISPPNKGTGANSDRRQTLG
jgi:hypothetical protein